MERKEKTTPSGIRTHDLRLGDRCATTAACFFQIMYLKFPGTLFLRMLKGMILPLIIPALIAASGSMDLSLSAKIGIRVVVYYFATTVLAVFEGIFLVSVIQPGNRADKYFDSDLVSEKNVTNVDMLMDLVRNLFPTNLVQATLEKTQTVVLYPGQLEVNGSMLDTDRMSWDYREQPTHGTNILGLIVVSMVSSSRYLTEAAY